MSERGAHIVCLGCGRTVIGRRGDPTDIAPSSHCGDCPPWTCDGCGRTCSAQALCPCWVPLADLPLADIKGLLARGGLSVDTNPGRL